MKCSLETPGWNRIVRRSLERLIERGAGRRLPAVFDFDNTIIGGDVGEAVLAMLSAQGRLSTANVCKTLCPDLALAGRKKIALETCCDLMEYYEALLTPTVHGPADPTPLANGYVWATEILEGLTLAEVLAATARAHRLGQANHIGSIDLAAPRSKYPAPRLHEEMLELIAQLLRFEYDVWIVSASNVWSVRWMVLHAINPLLKARGLSEGLLPDHVIGVATLLSDRKGNLYKDSVLVREDSRYATLDAQTAKAFRITRYLQFPAPVYSGKVACVLDAIGRNPYLCAGDSPSDHPMLKLSRHRLWLARSDKPDSQRTTQALVRQTGKRGWLVQCVLNKFEPRPLSPGFGDGKANPRHSGKLRLNR